MDNTKYKVGDEVIVDNAMLIGTIMKSEWSHHYKQTVYKIHIHNLHYSYDYFESGIKSLYGSYPFIFLMLI